MCIFIGFWIIWCSGSGSRIYFWVSIKNLAGWGWETTIDVFLSIAGRHRCLVARRTHRCVLIDSGVTSMSCVAQETTMSLCFSIKCHAPPRKNFTFSEYSNCHTMHRFERLSIRRRAASKIQRAYRAHLCRTGRARLVKVFEVPVPRKIEEDIQREIAAKEKHCQTCRNFGVVSKDHCQSNSKLCPYRNYDSSRSYLFKSFHGGYIPGPGAAYITKRDARRGMWRYKL